MRDPFDTGFPTNELPVVPLTALYREMQRNDQINGRPFTRWIGALDIRSDRPTVRIDMSRWTMDEVSYAETMTRLLAFPIETSLPLHIDDLAELMIYVHGVVWSYAKSRREHAAKRRGNRSAAR